MRIIIVEDEERSRKGLVSLIRLVSSSYNVIAQAYDGKRGYELIRKLHPDLVFTDIYMPVMDGLELIKAIREEHIDTRFIIVSAYEKFEYARTAMVYGVQDYILKPIIFEDIQTALDRVNSSIEESFNLTPLTAYDNTKAKKSMTHPSVRRALTIIEKEYASPLAQEDLAKRLRVTPQYFSYLFHRDVGVNFSNYLKEYRIEMAKSLLTQTDMKVSDIAVAIGYNATKYFCRVFKLVTNLSPTEYTIQYK